jgi:acetyl-CoA carboxylase biotin carboxyl carrier protein
MELELDFVRSLVKLMSEHNLQELSLEDGDRKLKLLRDGPKPAASVPAVVPAVMPGLMPNMGAAMMGAMPGMAGMTGMGSPVHGASDKPVGEAPEDDFEIVLSPMVGTFYRSPSPDSDPFVEKGDRVTEDSTVAIIEAMKVMNEIKAECAGEIINILVVNGEAVEYGQPLFHIRKTT